MTIATVLAHFSTLVGQYCWLKLGYFQSKLIPNPPTLPSPNSIQHQKTWSQLPLSWHHYSSAFTMTLLYPLLLLFSFFLSFFYFLFSFCLPTWFFSLFDFLLFMVHSLQVYFFLPLVKFCKKNILGVSFGKSQNWFNSDIIWTKNKTILRLNWFYFISRFLDLG